MSAYVTLLQARRTAIVTELNALASTTVGGKPNILEADGGTHIDHQGYKMNLYKELAEIDAAILRDQNVQAQIDDADGPAWEMETRCGT